MARPMADNKLRSADVSRGGRLLTGACQGSGGTSTRRWPLLWQLLLLGAVCFGVGSGAALAHSVFYSFPYYPYEFWTGPDDHYHKHWANPGLPDDYMARFSVDVRQTTAGSFDWLNFQSGYGADLNSRGWLGMLYLTGPNGEIFRSDTFYCTPVTSYAVYGPWPFPWNPGTQGYWRQDNGGGGQ